MRRKYLETRAARKSASTGSHEKIFTELNEGGVSSKGLASGRKRSKADHAEELEWQARDPVRSGRALLCDHHRVLSQPSASAMFPGAPGLTFSRRRDLGRQRPPQLLLKRRQVALEEDRVELERLLLFRIRHLRGVQAATRFVARCSCCRRRDERSANGARTRGCGARAKALSGDRSSAFCSELVKEVRRAGRAAETRSEEEKGGLPESLPPSILLHPPSSRATTCTAALRTPP